ncbi:hypothetical protein EK904_015159 [Melospiza melodia maxima]|nr:hypothetical protein EK904_015159 [Melospiza melodia maxima]
MDENCQLTFFYGPSRTCLSHMEELGFSNMFATAKQLVQECWSVVFYQSGTVQADGVECAVNVNAPSLRCPLHQTIIFAFFVTDCYAWENELQLVSVQSTVVLRLFPAQQERCSKAPHSGFPSCWNFPPSVSLPSCPWPLECARAGPGARGSAGKGQGSPGHSEEPAGQWKVTALSRCRSCPTLGNVIPAQGSVLFFQVLISFEGRRQFRTPPELPGMFVPLARLFQWGCRAK